MDRTKARFPQATPIQGNNRKRTLGRLSQRLTSTVIKTVAFCGLVIPAASQAQFGIGGGGGTGPVFPPTGDLQAKYNSYDLDILGDDMMGEHIDLDTGDMSVIQWDVSLPGNNALPVAFGRQLKRDKFGQRMGLWEATVPSVKWHYVSGHETNEPRCSRTHLYPQDIFNPQYAVLSYMYFQGYMFDIPGQSPGSMAEIPSNSSGMSPEFTGTNAVMVSKNDWYVTCVNNIPAGGEGFKAHAPDGTKYIFAGPILAEGEPDLIVNHSSDGSIELQVGERGILLSRIEDVHGNWVNYVYNGNNDLTRIHSSDGREITFTYSSGKLRTVNANGRTWTYNYAGWKLASVVLPDGRSWNFDIAWQPFDEYLTGICALSNGGIPDSSITHPSGTTATFSFDVIRNGRKNVTYAQVDPGTPPPTIEQCHIGNASSKSASGFWSFAVTAKTLTVPGAQDQVWTREYEEDNGDYATYPAGISDTKKRTLTDPEGNKTVYYFDRRDRSEEGSLVKIETFAPGASSPIRIVENSYTSGNYVGWDMSGRGVGNVSNHSKVRRIYQTQSVITQDGETYTTTSAFQTDPAATDFAYGRPSSVTNSTSATHPASAMPNSRTTVYTYEHKKTPWVLSLSKTVSVAGENTAEYSYNSLGQKTEEKAFGYTQATYGYHTSGVSKGALYWMRDAENGHSQALDWHRGTPRHIRQWLDDATDGSGGRWVNQYVTVDNNGWVTGRTDANGYIWSYDRDVMGRMTQIDPPGSAFNSTSIAYNFNASGAFPVTQTITKGSATTIVRMDARHRPHVVEQSTSGWSSTVETEYDALGRTVFTSLPSSTIGSRTEYDALGRVTKTWTGSRTSTSSSGELLTQMFYEADNRVRIISPAGDRSDTWRDGLSGPGEGEVLQIFERQGSSTVIRRTRLFRDALGRMTRLHQYGTIDGLYRSESHYFAYDNRKRLCRYYIPEGGSTLALYDDRGVVTAFSKGNAQNAACGSLSGNNVVNIDTDSLYRQIRVNYADSGTLDTDFLYDDLGNMTRTRRGTLQGSGAMSAVDNTLTRTYGVMGEIRTEAQSGVGFPATFEHVYGYDANGFINSRRNPANITTSWTNNGFGHQQSLGLSGNSGAFASNISYHPDGSLAGYTAGNGQAYTRSLDHLQRTQRLRSVSGSYEPLDLTFTYDTASRISSIMDGSTAAVGAAGKRQTVTNLTYDGLGQLKTANGWWGNGSFTYDSLGNVRSRTLGTRTITNSYNNDNELTQVADSLGLNDGGTATRAVQHDVRGNITALGGLSMVYDYSDQMRNFTGSTRDHDGQVVSVTNGTYSYNGEGKRVRSIIDGVTTWFAYDHRGKLTYIRKSNADTTSKIYLETGQLLAKQAGSEITFMHADHLGTPIRGTAGSGHATVGAEVFAEFYTPFGMQPTQGWLGNTGSGLYGSGGLNAGSGSNAGVTGFTDHTFDSDTGLTYMQARHYDPVAGRFLSVDPVTFMQDGRTGMFGRYTYTLNDPVGMVDPDGENPLVVLKVIGKKYGKRKLKQRLLNSSNLTQNAEDAIDVAFAAMDSPSAGVVEAGRVALERIGGGKLGDKVKKTYQTYVKQPRDPSTHSPYSGRTSGTGTPAQNVANRDRNHHMNETHGPAELDRSSDNPDAIRGRENQLIEANGGAQSAGGTSGNKIRGIADSNPKKSDYERACREEFC